MTEHEELIELRRIGDHMQSSLSRVLEGVREVASQGFSYEQEMAAIEAKSAIQEWTNVRRKSMRLFTRKEADALKAWCPICKTHHVSPGERTDSGRPVRPCPRLTLEDGAQHNGYLYYTDGSRTRMPY